MIGLKRGTVQLCEHEKEWEVEAQNTIARLKEILGDVIKDIQHVGSTSILTIKAKPIIDIAVAVDKFDDILAYEKELKDEGFYYRPKSDLGAQLLFASGSLYEGTGDLQTHFIHVVLTDSMDWINYINFRDYLNRTPSVAKEYEDLKVSLALQAPIDSGREKYLEGKHDFIVYTLRKALVKSYLGKTVTILIDRPIGSVHPPETNGENYAEAYYYAGMKSLGEDSDEADYYLTKAVEYGHGRAAFMLSKLYKDGTLEPPDKSASKRYLYHAVELGDSVAEYVQGKELLEKDAEQGRKLLESSASKGNAQAMYLLGKRLFDEGKTEEGLRRLEEAASRDLWAQTQLGLLYFYKLGDRAKGTEHINHASRSDYAPARAAVRQINRGRNAYIAAGIVNLFYHLGRIIEDSTTRYDEGYGIDSRLRRELEQKKRGEPTMSM